MVIYSHSKLSTFEQCPFKFKLRYIDKIKPEVKDTIESFLGNKVHNVLQWIYAEASRGRILQLDEVVKYFIYIWNKDFNQEIKIVKQEYNSEYYFNQGIKFIVDYFMKYSPFQDNTIALEKRIIINLDDLGKYKLQGYIDRIVYHKDTNILEIHDYKTNGFLKPQEELDKDRQLALYAIGLKDIFKGVNDIYLVWHFLAFNKKMISKRTEEQLTQLKQEIIELIDKIESTTEFPAKSSPLCEWCGFKNYCDLACADSCLEEASPESVPE